MPNSSRFTTEHVLYALAVAAALTVRLWGLGHAPLGETEAHLALQVLDVAAHQPAPLGDAPLLTGLTGLAFFLFGSTDAVARLVPALLGGLLPLLALPLRKPLGRRAALLMAFALAFDPGLVALSRVADSPVPALLMLSAAALAAARARWDWALPLAALGALLGPSFWFGALAWLLALTPLRVLGSAVALPAAPENLRRGLWRAAATLLVGSTLAFWMPAGFGAITNSLLAFLRTLFAPTGMPAGTLFFTLMAYAPLAFGAGLVGAVVAFLRRQPVTIFAALLTASALTLALLSPSRQPAALAWVLLPLWALAAWALAQLPRLHRETGWQSALIVALLMFSWLTLTGWSRTVPDTRPYHLTLLLSILGFLLVPLLGSILALSWKAPQTTLNDAFGGLTWGLTLAGALFTVSALMHAAYAPRSGELWYPAPAAPQQRLLEATLADLGQQHHGMRDTLPVTVVAAEPHTATLRWLLRRDPNARFVDTLPAESHPEALLAATPWEPAQASAYRGQAFPLHLLPPLDGTDAQRLVQWLTFRPLPSPAPESEVTLWVRTDLFPDAQTAP